MNGTSLEGFHAIHIWENKCKILKSEKRYNYFNRQTFLHILALMVLSFPAILASTQTTPAYQVKAAFLYNFSQFVEWPKESLQDNAPFVIGIIGDDPFGNYIDTLVKGEKAGNHPIVVRRFNSVVDVEHCQILYLNVANSAEVAKSLGDRSILTISDAENFASEGGMIRFVTTNNKIRLQINPSVVRAAKLDISSKLLRLAEIIE